MFKWIIILIVLYFLQNLFAYKFIKYIDKKERKKVNKMEENHINFMLENSKDEHSISG